MQQRCQAVHPSNPFWCTLTGRLIVEIHKISPSDIQLGNQQTILQGHTAVAD